MSPQRGFMQNVRLGARLIYRERKSHSLKVLYSVLALATLVMTILNGLNAHAWRMVYDKAATSFGADLIVYSHLPMDARVISQANEFNLKSVEVVTSLTMARFEQQFKLVSLKVVGPGYPLKGEVLIQHQQTPTSVMQGPDKGTLWVEPRLLSELGVSIGQAIQIGEKTFKLAAHIEKEPDAASSLSLLAPRVIMNIEDLTDTQVIQPGSRVRYALWFAGDLKDIESLKSWVKSQNHPDWEMKEVTEGRSPLQRLVEYSSSYLGLIIMLTVLLTGVSVSLSARLWINERLTTFTIYRVLGASPRHIVKWLIYGLLFWGLIIVVLMVLLGQVMNAGFISIAAHYLPVGVFEVSLKSVMLSMTVALFILIGFSLPEVLLTAKLSPIKILRSGDYKLPTLYSYYGITVLICVALLYFYVDNLWLTLILIAGFGWAAFLGYLLLLASIALLTRLPFKGVSFKLAVHQLKYRQAAGAAQVLCLTLVLMVVVVLNGVSNGLLKQWQGSLPENTPNHFLINIPLEQMEPLEAFINPKLKEPIQFYPIVRGRVTHVKQQAISDMEGSIPEGLNRPLNITWLKQLPQSNPIKQGPDWHDELKGQPVISIEQGFASRIKASLGDELTFNIAGQTLTGKIYNIREVTWQSFKPNFYIIFPEGVLENVPAMAITSFYLPVEDNVFLARLGEQFPELTILAVDKIIKEVQVLLSLLVKVLNILMGLVLFFAFIILYVVLISSKTQRLLDASLLRLIGGNKSLLQNMTLIEYMILSLVTVITGAGGGTWILFELSDRLFNVSYQADWLTLFILSVCSFIILVSFGATSLRALVKQSPLALLKN